MKFNMVAEALIEERMVNHAHHLTAVEEGILLTSFCMIRNIPIDLDLENEGQSLATEIEENKTVSEIAKLFCNKCLADGQIRHQRAVSSILFEACQLGGVEARWAIDICKRMIKPSIEDSTGFWVLMYEVTSGQRMKGL